MTILYYASKFHGCDLTFNQGFDAVYNPSFFSLGRLRPFSHKKRPLIRLHAIKQGTNKTKKLEKKILEKFKNWNGIIWSHEVL